MKLGSLLMPSHAPEISIHDGQLRDLEEIRHLDALGYEEAWIGEHFTASWEPCPAPDLLIAQALLQTKRIRLGPLGHLLPYHHPVELAHRIAYLDHLAQGRYQLGVGISALPTDHQLFAIDSSGGTNRKMTFESLDMMMRLWREGGQDFKGEFWSMGRAHAPFGELGAHLRPFQKPYPPIAIAGLTPNSENHKLAGEKGFIPVSFCVSPDDSIVARHWDAVVEGAKRSGREPDRNQWRVIRDVFVAPTDEEALTLAIEGGMGRCWREFLLPVYKGLGYGAFLKHDSAMRDDEVDPAYLARHLWFVGSPQTVADKIVALQKITGGFGRLLTVSYDYEDRPDVWSRSRRLMIETVLPLVNQALAKTF